MLNAIHIINSQLHFESFFNGPTIMLRLAAKNGRFELQLRLQAFEILMCLCYILAFRIAPLYCISGI